MTVKKLTRWGSYLLLEIKKGMTLIPFFVVSIIGTSLAVLLAAVLFCAVMDRQNILPRASVAIVTTRTDSETDVRTDANPDFMTTLAVNTVSQMESVKLLADFSYITQEEADRGLADGSVDAAIYIAPDTYNDINNGINTPVTVKLSAAAASLERNLFASLVSAGVRMIRTVEASVYTPYRLSESAELTAEPAAIGDMIFDLYLKLALGRTSLWQAESVSAFGNLTLLQFYMISGFVLFLMLFGIGFRVFYSDSESEVLRMLARSGVPLPASDAARLTAVTLVLLVFGLLLTGLCHLLPAADNAEAAHTVFTLSSFGMLCLLSVLLASCIHLAGKLLPESAFPLTYTLCVILLFITGGGLLPTVWLPPALRAAAAFSPVSLSQHLAEAILVPGILSGAELQGICITSAAESILFFILAAFGGRRHGK